MEVKTFTSLPEEAAKIRKAVFMQEQGFTNEFDDVDDTAVHLVLYKDGLPVATCRYFHGPEEKSYVVGRVAVIRSCRGQSLGAEILREAERQIRAQGGKQVSLSAQTRVTGFYEKQGYHAQGSSYYDEFCLHIQMFKNLESAGE